MEDDLARTWFASDLRQPVANRQPVHTSRRRALIATSVVALGLALPSISGCYGPPPKPVFPEGEEDRFVGLDIALDSSGPQHVLIVKTPTGGYQCTVEFVADSFDGKDVYLLIREPNNLYVYSTTARPARIATGVESKIPIRVLAHQAPHNTKVDREAYRLTNLNTTAPAAAPATTPKP